MPFSHIIRIGSYYRDTFRNSKRIVQVLGHKGFRQVWLLTVINMWGQVLAKPKKYLVRTASMRENYRKIPDKEVEILKVLLRG